MKKSALFLVIASASFALAGCQDNSAETVVPESEVAAEAPAVTEEVPAEVPADAAVADDAAGAPVADPAEAPTEAPAATTE